MKLPWVSRKKYDLLSGKLEARNCELAERYIDIGLLKDKEENLKKEYERLFKLLNRNANRKQKRGKDGKWCK